MKSLKVKGGKWSLRSQASFQREAALQRQVDNLALRIRHCQRMVDEAQAAAEANLKRSMLGGDGASEAMSSYLERARILKDEIGLLNSQRGKVQAQIDALAKVSPADAKARAEHQTALAELALERLKCDQELASVIRTANGLLEKRRGMTGQMLAVMRKIDFALGFDGLDSDRFEALEKSLPGDLEGRSEAYVEWLLGENQKTERYTVLHDTLFFAETLANANVYRHGEEVDLTAEQVAEIQSTEQSRVEYPSEALPGGGFRAGSRTEIREPRVEKCAEAAKQDA